MTLQTGFRGLTSYLFVRASCRKENFSEAGFLARNRGREGYTPVDSDVVCFVSSAADDVGHHEALMTAADLGSFPPNTLYRLVEVIEAGGWLAPGGEVRPQRRLLVVKATYLSMTSVARAGVESKMTSLPSTLQYSTRDAYIKGLDDILAKPALTMAQEFGREKR